MSYEEAVMAMRHIPYKKVHMRMGAQATLACYALGTRLSGRVALWGGRQPERGRIGGLRVGWRRRRAKWAGECKGQTGLPMNWDGARVNRAHP